MLLPRVSPSYASSTSRLAGALDAPSPSPRVQQFPPFQPDTPVGPPRVCIWQHLPRSDFNKLEAFNYNKEKVFQFFETKYPDEKPGPARKILFELLYEVLRFCRINSYCFQKTSALFSIYYITHEYFRASMWRTAEETYNYFKETILLHTVQRPPKSAEILEPHECRATLLHFCKVYLRHLPLIHLTTLPTYALELWTPDVDVTPMQEQEVEQELESLQQGFKTPRAALIAQLHTLRSDKPAL